MNNQIFSIGKVIDANQSFTVSNQNVRSGNGLASVVSLNAKSNAQKIEPNVNEIEQQAKQLNDFIKQSELNLKYSVDDDSGFIVITVTEEDTGKFVRQIPAEEFIAIASLLTPDTENQEVTTGLLIADKV